MVDDTFSKRVTVHKTLEAAIDFCRIMGIFFIKLGFSY